MTIRVENGSSSGLKSRPIVYSSSSTSLSSYVQTSNPQIKPQNSVPTKQRSLSPHAETNLSDTFREAKFEKRRFSTPEPHRSVSDRGFTRPKKWPNSRSSSSASPLQQLKSVAGGRSRKYFNTNGGRFSAVEEVDGWTVDILKLFLGSKFAHGAHSRLYHGMYDDTAMAVKIISLPKDHEVGGTGGLMTARLEREYVS